MSELRTKFTERLTCSICQELFTTPKLLDCQHKFCEDCFSGYILSRHDQPTVGIPCPECRQLSKVKNYRQGLRKRDWASQYPTDFTVKSLCEVLNASENSDLCPRHEKQVLYCQSCKSCFCEDCDHDCLGFIPVQTEVIKRKADLQSQLEPLRKMSKKMRYNLKITKTEKEELDNNYNTTTEKIRDQFNRIQEMVKEEEKNLLDYVQDVRNVTDSRLCKCEQEQKRRLRLISIAEKELSNAISTKSSVLFIEKTQKNFKEFEDCEEDVAIVHGSYSKRTKFSVNEAAINDMRELIKGIGADCHSHTVTKELDAESNSENGFVMSPPPTPRSDMYLDTQSTSSSVSSPEQSPWSNNNSFIAQVYRHKR